ncbi:MAG: hypothetical protein IKE75_02070 [Bacilli bacterium]|nr:hypothetical protein [Bacilli bacterium]
MRDENNLYDENNDLDMEDTSSFDDESVLDKMDNTLENVTERKRVVERRTKVTRVEKNQKQKKGNKKKIIIIGLVALFLIVALIIGLLLGNKKEEPKKEKAIKEKWGQIYYEYLKDMKDEDSAKEAGLSSKMKDATMVFYDIDTLNYPVMAIDYELDNKDYANVYFIEDGKVDAIIYNDPTDIELLYNIQNKDYNYYTKSTKDGASTYKSIKDQIRSKLRKSSSNDSVKDYTFKDDDKDTVKDVNGNEISLTKFEQTFIKVDTDNKGVSYDTDLSKKALEKVVNKSIKKYEKVEKILTSDVKKSIQTREEGIVKKQEEMNKAKEDVTKKEELEKAKKEADEKAKKEAEEKAKNAGLTVGSYTLKYGTYKGQDASEGLTFVLKQNGQCVYAGKNCTYTIGSHDFTQDGETHVVRQSLIIKESGGTSWYYMPYSNTEIGDGDINRFVYNG